MFTRQKDVAYLRMRALGWRSCGRCARPVFPGFPARLHTVVTAKKVVEARRRDGIWALDGDTQPLLHHPHQSAVPIDDRAATPSIVSISLLRPLFDKRKKPSGDAPCCLCRVS
jgi:hypothetical protein